MPSEEQINTPKIVVVTPVRNEAWILERFLRVTETFADHIIISDQNSIDNSREICSRFPKVEIIENPGINYDEATRQLALIARARELVPGRKIILALDADEILAANAQHQAGWKAMLTAEPGTVLCFEKPDLYLSTRQCIRYNTPWPIGYVDDGAEHKPKKIHSIRIPMPDKSPVLAIHDVKVLHYGYIRVSGQASKMRMYSSLENCMGTQSLWRRRVTYSSNKDYVGSSVIEICPEDWFSRWEASGISMHTILAEKYYWYDYEILKLFYKYGTKRFWGDDIWNFDWESFRLYAKSQGVEEIPTDPIAAPPRLLRASLRIGDSLLQSVMRLKRLY